MNVLTVRGKLTVIPKVTKKTEFHLKSIKERDIITLPN